MFDGIQVNMTQSNKKSFKVTKDSIFLLQNINKKGNLKCNLIMSLKSKLKVEFMIIIIFLFVDVENDNPFDWKD